LLEHLTGLFFLGSSALFNIYAEVNDLINFGLSAFGFFDKSEDQFVNEGGAAEGFLGTNFSALHFAGESNFSFTGKERNRTHFTKVDSDGVVSIDRFFLLWLAVIFGFFRLFAGEEPRLLVEGYSQCFGSFLNQKLIVKGIHSSSPHR